jgi:two-component system cell cycle response regulator DivK
MARVLVVEDNPVNMKLAALLLHRAGHAVLCAVDAETGLLLARSVRPDLVLMDIQLPGMDGLAAAALLKQDPATAAIPIIALTALAMKTGQEKNQVAGFDAHISKPLRYQELYAAIEALLGKGQLQGRVETGLPGVTVSLQSIGEANPQAATVEVVDVGVLQGLIGNNPSMILEFLSAFRISAAKIALELKAACDARQTMLASQQAHKLRSSARSVGAKALGELCAEIETAGKAGRAAKLTALLPLFEHELDAVNVFLDARLLPKANPGSYSVI